MNIALITGGPSAEREVSLSTGRSILIALRENGHKVRVIDPIYGSEEVGEEKIFSEFVKRESPSPEELNKIREKSNRNILECFNSRLFDGIDIAFLGVHGKFGEDGKIQSLLELRGIAYTGSDVFSSALAMDKDYSKILFRYNGVNTPRWINLDREDFADELRVNEQILESVGYPCVVKPNDEGSTVGLSIVQPDVEDVQLRNAIELAFSYSGKVMIEQYIKGRELTAAVIGNDVLPVIEIRPKDGFYDYEHKYTKGMTDYFCPAEIPGEVERKVREDAVKAHKSLGCTVYSRVDFILDEKNELYCLEVNTLPGMTETSLVPKAAAAAGMSFSELIEKIISLSYNKYRNNRKI